MRTDNQGNEHWETPLMIGHHHSPHLFPSCLLSYFIPFLSPQRRPLPAKKKSISSRHVIYGIVRNPVLGLQLPMGDCYMEVLISTSTQTQSG